MGGLAVNIKSTPRSADWEPIAEKFFGDLGVKLADAHLKWVFLVLEYTQRDSRVDTGRSRAAWTPIMDKYGYDYQRSMPMGDRENQDDVTQGKAEGQFYDDPFNTTIVNNVDYVEPMDRKYGIFGFSPSRAGLPSGLMGEKTRGGRQKLFGVNDLGNRVTRGIRFEEKVPMFESFGQAVFQKIADNAKAAFEKNRNFKPSEIEPVVNDPPISM